MLLDEAETSALDSGALPDLLPVIYGGSDARPGWIGPHRPATTDPDRRLQAQCHWASIHYDYYLNFVRDEMTTRGRVLDLGCGAGHTTAMLARYATHATGMDSDPVAIAFALRHNVTRGVHFIRGHFPQVRPDLPVYDYVFMIETIEHVAYNAQLQFLMAALALLAPGGRLFLTTPIEEVAMPPHIGVWSTSWRNWLLPRLGPQVLSVRYCDNTDPVGFKLTPASHYAVVLGA